MDSVRDGIFGVQLRLIASASHRRPPRIAGRGSVFGQKPSGAVRTEGNRSAE